MRRLARIAVVGASLACTSGAQALDPVLGFEPGTSGTVKFGLVGITAGNLILGSVTVARAYRSHNLSRWTWRDTLLEAEVEGALALDMFQTLSLRNDSRFYETNRFLGPHPSEAGVVGYFAGWMAVHAAVAYLLPQPWRAAWQCVDLQYEAMTIGNNAELGIGMRLPF